MAVAEEKPQDMIGLFRIWGPAFEDAFTQRNVQASFGRLGMRPINPYVLINVPRLATSRSDETDLLRPEGMRAMLRGRSEEVRNFIMGAKVTIAACRYINTTHGVLFNYEEVLSLAEKKREMDAAKERIAEKKRIQAELKDARYAKERRKEQESMRNYMNGRRAHLASRSLTAFTQSLWTMRERRAIAKGKAKGCRQIGRESFLIYLSTAVATLKSR